MGEEGGEMTDIAQTLAELDDLELIAESTNADFDKVAYRNLIVRSYPALRAEIERLQKENALLRTTRMTGRLLRPVPLEPPSFEEEI